MAERRMINKSVVSNDKFMNMSHGAQMLYFYMMFRADDDGFVGDSRLVCKALGYKKSHMMELIQNQYVFFFPSGVAVIMHWRMHNQVSPSKKRPTIYTDELRMLTVNENKSYGLSEELYDMMYEHSASKAM